MRELAARITDLSRRGHVLAATRRLLLIAGLVGGTAVAAPPVTARGRLSEEKTMTIKSPDFENAATIPERFSQYDANRSPPLEISGVPPDAQSLVLIMDDPDAPRGLFTHWVVFNIDPKTTRFQENQTPKGAQLGHNSYDRGEYAGPRPPNGEHRYFFHLFALDVRPDLRKGASRADVERMMQGHVIAKAELMGRFATPVNAR